MVDWKVIKDIDVCVIDGKVKYCVIHDYNGGWVTAYVYRKSGKAWIKDQVSSPSAVRSGLKRNTIKII